MLVYQRDPEGIALPIFRRVFCPAPLQILRWLSHQWEPRSRGAVPNFFHTWTRLYPTWIRRG